MNEDSLKRILAWASVSYALGFAIVTLHTARLGLPVIELIQPIYIWIGLPLAVVAASATLMLRTVAHHVQSATHDFRRALAEASGPAAPNDALPHLLGILFTMVPFGGIIAQLVMNYYVAARQKAISENSEGSRSRWLVVAGRLIWAAVLLEAIFRLLRITGLVAMGVLALWAYIWWVYPNIPKSLGGGKPTQVQLVIERKALPVKMGGMDVNKIEESDTITLDAWLLYQTADYIYLQLASGDRMGIRGAMVQTIVWSHNRQETAFRSD